VGEGYAWWMSATRDVLMRTVPVVVLDEDGGDLARLLQSRGTTLREAFFLIGPMISFDEAILFGMMRIADPRDYSQRVTAADQGSREIRALRGTHPTRVPIQRDGAGQSVHLKRVRDRLQSSFGVKLGTD